MPGFDPLHLRILKLSPRSGFEELERTKVDLVISDYLMPQMTGIDLLRRVKQVQPEAVRILLTGFADKENAIRAVNTVGLYQYLEKPWDTEALLLAVRNALKEKGLRCQLAERIHAFDKLFLEHRQLAERHLGAAAYQERNRLEPQSDQ